MAPTEGRGTLALNSSKWLCGSFELAEESRSDYNYKNQITSLSYEYGYTNFFRLRVGYDYKFWKCQVTSKVTITPYS